MNDGGPKEHSFIVSFTAIELGALLKTLTGFGAAEIIKSAQANDLPERATPAYAQCMASVIEKLAAHEDSCEYKAVLMGIVSK